MANTMQRAQSEMDVSVAEVSENADGTTPHPQELQRSLSMETLPTSRAGGDLQGMESILNCIICMEPYKDPRVLACQHTFCRECLENLYESNCRYGDPGREIFIPRGQFPCPTCRMIIPVPRGGIPNLPGDFKLGHIRELLKKVNFKGRPSKHCEVCKFQGNLVTSNHYCMQCSKFICATCVENHETSPLFDGHAIVNALPSDLSVLECQEHGEEVKYFCVQCQNHLCTVCALSKHAKHDIQEIVRAAPFLREDIQDALNLMASRLEEHKEKLREVTKIKCHKEQIYEEAHTSIKQHVERLFNRIKERERELLEELENLHETELKQVNSEVEGTEVKCSSISSFCNHAESLLDHRQMVKLAASYKDLQARVENLSDVAKWTPIPEDMHKNVKFGPSRDLHVGIIGFDIDVNIVDEPLGPSAGIYSDDILNALAEGNKDSNGDSSASANSVIENYCSSPDGGSFASAPSSPRDISPETQSGDSNSSNKDTSGSSNTTGTTNQNDVNKSQNGEQGISTIEEGSTSSIRPLSTPTSPRGRGPNRRRSTSRPRKTIVSREGGFGIIEGDDGDDNMSTCSSEGKLPLGKIDFDPNAEFHIVWEKSGFQGARDMTFLSEGNIACTESENTQNYLQVFDTASDVVSKIFHGESTTVVPWGVCADRDTGKLAVADQRNGCVIVLDADLSLNHTLNYRFIKPSGVAILNTGEYVVTSTGFKNKVSIHAPDGHLNRELQTPPLESFRSPEFVTTDEHDRIIVSDTMNNCIKVFDKSGQFLFKFGDTLSDQLTILPRGVCTDSRNNLLVVTKIGEVHMYSPDGKHIQRVMHLPSKHLRPFGMATLNRNLLGVVTDKTLCVYHVPKLLS